MSDRAAQLKHLLETEGDAVSTMAQISNVQRYQAYESTEGIEEFRSKARAIKEQSIERLPSLIETVTEAVEANGGTVHLAEDATDATRYIREVAQGADAETAVKSKSMTTEEIELNDALEADDLAVYETDLGEFVLQVADDTPSHIVGPAMHLSREEIAELFTDHFDPDDPFETAEELTAFARDYLGERIEDADIGITGANFVLADSGTIVLVTNEGNARKCAVTPDVHVAVAGVEKLIPSITELEPFANLIARSATGQDITQYLSLLSPPTGSPTVDFDRPDEPLGSGEGSREFHLVLLDNGRMAMREDDQLRETLYCIRCGACSNSCANFQQVGGHGFGGETYSGGIATGWETGVHGLESAATFNDLCTGCTRCVNACPVKIDIPWINTVVRDRLNRGEADAVTDILVDGLVPDDEPSGTDLEARLLGSLDTAIWLGHKTAPLSNWVTDLEPVRTVLERTLGIDRRRPLPTFAGQSLVEWFDRRGGSRVDPRSSERTAVLYPDVYTNYVDPERGRAAVRALEACGVAVEIPPLPESGRIALSQGLVSSADQRASEFYAAVAESLDAGRDLVVIEPSDLAAITREYEHFLPERGHERLTDATSEICAYVGAHCDPGALASGDGRVAFHAHCQARTLGLEQPTVSLLEDIGYGVRTSTVECCGMAGLFGYRTDTYDVSMAVGEGLATQFEGADRIVASGTSCQDQLADLLEREIPHPIELVDPAA